MNWRGLKLDIVITLKYLSSRQYIPMWCITVSDPCGRLQMVLVQYVVVRGDLLARQGWPLGAVLAQACHAATAAIHLYYRQQILRLSQLLYQLSALSVLFSCPYFLCVMLMLQSTVTR